ncbi:hypothetical protein GCM10027592_58700 [Spirosoma flavus]
MRAVLFSLLAVTTLATSPVCLAQKPNYEVILMADGKPLDLSQGISARTKVLQLLGQLDQKSLQQYPQLKTTVLINKAILNLVRDTRRVAYEEWPGDGSIAGLFQQAKAGDRFVIQFDDVESLTKQGMVQKIDSAKLIQLTVKE